MNTYTNSEFTLTEKEEIFISIMLKENGCNACTPEELLSDNFSCQTMEDFIELTEFSKYQIAGLISSLQSKNVIMIEDDRGQDGYKKVGRKLVPDMLPDLYWVQDSYLESLDPEMVF